jgi:tetratricopeptide (TPR) repeat protein
VSSTSRKTKAIWNILSQSGRKAHVVGWYASHPAEPINGVCVSNQFAEPSGPRDQPWPMSAGSVHTPALEQSLAALRVHPQELMASDLRPFIPRLSEIDPSDPRPGVLARMIAKGASMHAAITAIVENEPWDFAAVYDDTIDLAGHYFMSFHPPKLPDVNEREFELYREVIGGIYRWHDMVLARLVQLAGEDATILLVSDHGFYSDHLRPRTAPAGVGAQAAAWHRQYGMFVMAGPGVLADERIYGATLLDVAPTVLSLLGLPVGADMDGKVLAQAFDHPIGIERIASWDDVPGDAGMHPTDLRIDPFSAAEAIRQLVDLGSLAAPSDEQRDAADLARQEWQYNLGATHLDAGEPLAALPILESLHANQLESPRFATLLAQCYSELGRAADCRRTVESLLARGIDTPELDLLLGWALFASGEMEPAMQRLRRAEQATPDSPALHCMIGRLYAHQQRWPDAQRAFARALEIDPDSELSHDGMALVLLALDRNEQAAEHALRAVGLTHFFPAAHYRLGLALARLGAYDRAAAAMEVAISMRPGMLDAHRYLAALYGRLGVPDQALIHRQTARRLWDSLKQRPSESSNEAKRPTRPDTNLAV